MNTGRKIIMLSLGMGGLAFVALFFVKNPLVSLLFVIPPLLFCPIACGAMGGLPWLVACPSKSKEMKNE
ncbi:MAG: hypothetical protein KGH88_07470 [Thaumarchaeota archaeon]|nr:hypothetical protein [Nitrososphaerota archaeon]